MDVHLILFADAQSSDSPTDNLNRLQSELLVPLPEGLSFDSVSFPSDAEGISHFRQFQRFGGFFSFSLRMSIYFIPESALSF